MVDSINILVLLIFSFIYLLLQQIKRVMVKELDHDVYQSIIEYYLLGEYSFIGLALMVLGRFNSLEIGIGFLSMIILRYGYNQIIYSPFYKKLARKIRSHNIYNK